MDGLDRATQQDRVRNKWRNLGRWMKVDIACSDDVPLASIAGCHISPVLLSEPPADRYSPSFGGVVSDCPGEVAPTLDINPQFAASGCPGLEPEGG